MNQTVIHDAASDITIVANLIRTCLRLRDRVRDIHLEPPPDGR